MENKYFTPVLDEFDKARCHNDIAVVGENNLEASSNKENHWTTVLGKKEVSAAMGSRFEWEVQLTTTDVPDLMIGLIQLPQQIDYQTLDYNNTKCFLKYLLSENTWIKGNAVACPQLGGQVKGQVVFKVRIDFDSSEISLKQGTGDFVTIAAEPSFAASKFSLMVSFYKQHQRAKIIQPARPLELEDGAENALDILGLRQDLEFLSVYQAVRSQMTSTNSFEKRLALLGLLSNEDRFLNLPPTGEPQQERLSKELLIEQMMTQVSAPIAALSPPSLPEARAALQNREDKLLLQLVSATGRLINNPAEELRPSLSLWAADTLSKTAMPREEAPPADPKEELRMKLPMLQEKIRGIPSVLFTTLTGLDKNDNSVRTVLKAIKDAFLLSLEVNQAPLPPNLQVKDNIEDLFDDL